MNLILIHIQLLGQKTVRHVWIRSTYTIQEFIEDVTSSWELETTHFPHFFYHLETKRILDSQQTLTENAVISGDHCLLI